MRVGAGVILCLFSATLFAETQTVTIQKKQLSLAEIARESVQKRTGKARVYTDADLAKAPALFVASPTSSVTVREGTPRVTPQKISATASMSEKDFNRLKSLCRSAGADASYEKPIQTDVYVVNGKTVKVTGPHANPLEVERAKRICQQALDAQPSNQKR